MCLSFSTRQRNAAVVKTTLWAQTVKNINVKLLVVAHWPESLYSFTEKTVSFNCFAIT